MKPGSYPVFQWQRFLTVLSSFSDSDDVSAIRNLHQAASRAIICSSGSAP